MKTDTDLTRIVESVKAVLPYQQNIGLHEPCFQGNEWKYLKECIDTGWVSSVGKFVDQFELKLADFTGVKKAIAVANGTVALHLCLKVIETEPDDEILVPALTFVATANAVSHCGAVCHFADSEEHTLGIDPIRLDKYLQKIAILKNGSCYNKTTGRRIKAVLPMHTFGHSVDLDALVEVCNTYKLMLVEDAAESLGSYYKGRHTGNHGVVSALSFNGNKIITTGGGGAVMTNDERLGRLAKHLSTTAKVPHDWAFYHDMVGYNYRMPNINAALGCAQLEQMAIFIKRKRALADLYAKALKDIHGVTFFTEPRFSKSNYWLNVILLQNTDIELRNRLITMFRGNGLMVRPAWTLINKLPMYKDCPSMELPVAEKIEASLVNLPSSAGLLSV
ncbi:MAG TPA: LegC family aminotransferase [Methylomusa anaerophila]|uniref:Putative pyridoxal phosphate-dependent aminotransferase EpsN n=1 Tax=Methylomusa anaerophila TaxID=1930071 RepID=A0A348AKV2_9FIRM|nr:LegC family aminotransferase [Methylomusa anaerophila]BBB91700.1 putative pyridoxal phosphate-dependent aminotransferase EpsN [Methylomusa anaerophila]HML88565.1 LegC family aminotransferase [Methylomusa anaerophila]